MTIFTPDLCDKYGDAVSVIELQFKHYGAARQFGGRVETIKCFEDNSLVAEQVRQAGEGRVLVVDGGGSPRRSLLGGNLASAAVNNGWAGIVIFGYLRDVEEIAPMKLGILALGSVPRKTEKRNEGLLGVPVKFGGIGIDSGHYLYADETGVIVASTSLLD